jgi:UrcA family protein
MRHHLLIPIAAIVLGGASDSVSQPSIQTVSVTVSTAGYDLNTAEGADALLKRLSWAATKACGGGPDSSPIVLRARQRYRACQVKALEAAVAQSRSELLKVRFARSQEAQPRRLAAQ